MLSGKKIFKNIDEFYQDNPRRKSSGEADYGCWWRDNYNKYVRYSISYVQATGEIYSQKAPDCYGDFEKIGAEKAHEIIASRSILNDDNFHEWLSLKQEEGLTVHYDDPNDKTEIDPFVNPWVAIIGFVPPDNSKLIELPILDDVVQSRANYYELIDKKVTAPRYYRTLDNILGDWHLYMGEGVLWVKERIEDYWRKNG